MKKIFSVTMVLLFGVFFAYSQSITVTKPGTGDAWTVGVTYDIIWTKTGTMDSKVKIRLYNSTGTSRVFNIVDDTENNGKFSWKIPETVTPGQYLVRVKTLDNSVYDDGNVFTVKAKPDISWNPNPEHLTKTASAPLPDFTVTEVFADDDFNLKAKVKNLGANFQGSLKFKFQIRSSTNQVEKSQVWYKNQIYLIDGGMKLTPPGTSGSIMISCEADPDKLITEKDENNNLKVDYARPDFHLPDFDVEDIFIKSNLGKPFELMAKIRNKGEDFRGQLEFSYTVKGHTTLITKNCWIGPGHVFELSTGRNLTGNDLESDGLKIKTAVKTDPNNKISEAKEWNNNMFKDLTPNFPRPDYIPTAARYGKTSNNKVYSPTGPCSYKGIKYSSYGEYYVTIKNIGQTYTGKIKVKVMVKGYTGWIPVKQNEINITLNNNQEKEFLIGKSWWYWCYLKGSRGDARVILTPVEGNTELNQSNNAWSGTMHE